MMKIGLGLRGLNFHPFFFSHGQPASDDITRKVIGWAHTVGFDGIEMEDCWVNFYEYTDEQLIAFKYLFVSMDMPVPCFKVRNKSLCHPAVREENREKLLRAVDIAELLESQVISVSLAASSKVYGVPEVSLLGSRNPPDCSREASEEDFKRTAETLKEVAEKAEKGAIMIAIEVHQYSVADTSASTLKLLEAIGMDNVRVNPDLGNMLWAYDEPVESWVESLGKLAPLTVWWHCKNLHRIHVPEIGRAFFVPTALGDGDIDYRYAITEMHKAGYDGYLLIEGVKGRDVLTLSRKSLEYVRSVFSDLI